MDPLPSSTATQPARGHPSAATNAADTRKRNRLYGGTRGDVVSVQEPVGGRRPSACEWSASKRLRVVGVQALKGGGH